MIELELDDLKTWFGFGVAGNFAGHLEQAGEAGDFATVVTPGDAPKGIFPWYVPGYDSFLGEFPLSHDTLLVPAVDSDDWGPLNLQIEPEVAPDVLFEKGAQAAREAIERLAGEARQREIHRHGSVRPDHALDR